MVRIQNRELKNSIISTRFGKYTFDSRGISTVPIELAKELLTLGGFTVIDNDGNPTELPSEVITRVTLDSGVIWESVAGGYTAEDGNKKFTISGNAIHVGSDNVVPTNVTVQSGKISVADDIDTTNFHVLGVTENDTILVGDSIFSFDDVDGDLTNGYELVEYIPPEPVTKVTLESGVVWEVEDGKYTATDNGKTYTFSGSSLVIGSDNVVPVNIVVLNGNLFIAQTIDTANLHVIGVNENDTITVGDKTYYWSNVDGNIENGYELVEYIPPTPPQRVTLESGVVWEKLENGYEVEEGNSKYFISGSAITTDETGIVPTNVTLQGGKFSFADDIDVTNLHVTGVSENSTITIGEKVYYWTNTDENATNGYELAEYIPPKPTKVTLESGVIWEVISTGYLATDNGTQYTFSGSAITTDDTEVVPNNITVQGGAISLDSNIDISNLHVIGVNKNDTIAVGDKTYYWSNVDEDSANGYELAEYIPPEPVTKVTLDSGVVWESIEGGYVATDGDKSYIFSGSAIIPDDTGVVPTNVTLQGGKIDFDSTIDKTNLHVIGVNENDTIAVGNKVYYWANTDDNVKNGYELVEYVEPGKVTLDSGVVWETVQGGAKVTNGNVDYTIMGVSTDETGVVISGISLQNDKLTIAPTVDKANLHVIGVNQGDTIQIGSSIYYWTDSDNNPQNGYELAEYVEPEPQRVTLDSGVIWEIIESDKYKVTEPNVPVKVGNSTIKVDVSLTVSGSAINTDDTGIVPTNITLQGGQLALSPDIDVNNLHIEGVVDNDTIRVGEKLYYFANTDNDLSNGYELVEYVEPEKRVTLDSGVVWESVAGGYVATDGDKSYTFSGSAVIPDSTGIVPVNITLQGGKIDLSPDIDVSNIHVLGVTAGDTIAVGDKSYYWVNADGRAENGCELILDTPDEPHEDDENGFAYDFDGVNFTLTGGLNATVTPEELNQTSYFSNEGLEFGDNIIANADAVHIQGLDSGTNVTISGQVYELQDTDNNLENGLELVGEDAFGWKRLNKSSGVYEPAIWKHFDSENNPDIVIIGCSSRPILEEGILTLNGDNIKVIANDSTTKLTLNGSINGFLTEGVGWEDSVGLVKGVGTGSHVFYQNNLYVPKAIIVGVSPELGFKLSGGIFTVLSGEIDVNSVKVIGNSISNVIYGGKAYYVNTPSGRLLPNAWKKRVK